MSAVNSFASGMFRAFHKPKIHFLTIFYYLKPRYFLAANSDNFENLELLLNFIISNSDINEVVEWHV